MEIINFVEVDMKKLLKMLLLLSPVVGGLSYAVNCNTLLTQHIYVIESTIVNTNCVFPGTNGWLQVVQIPKGESFPVIVQTEINESGAVASRTRSISKVWSIWRSRTESGL